MGNANRWRASGDWIDDEGDEVEIKVTAPDGAQYYFRGYEPEDADWTVAANSMRAPDGTWTFAPDGEVLPVPAEAQQAADDYDLDLLPCRTCGGERSTYRDAWNWGSDCHTTIEEPCPDCGPDPAECYDAAGEW